MNKVKKSKKWLIFSLAIALLTVAVVQTMNHASANQPVELKINRENNLFVLNAGELGAFYRTPRNIIDARLINLPESKTQVFTWNEQNENGDKLPFYAVSLDGKSIGTVQETSYEMMLRYGKFDPLVSLPQTPNNLTARTGTSADGVYIVQFVTQPLDEYRALVKSLGGKIYTYLPNHSYVVKMSAATRQSVENLPFVRWVGAYEPAYKLEEALNEGLENRNLGTARYNIMLLERGSTAQGRISQNVRTMGGKVDLTIPEGFRMEATLTGDQLLSIANENDVLFIDRWSAPESDMSVVREVGGANFIENTLGFKGQGVRAEVMDNGLRQTHGDFQTGGAPIIHNSTNTNESSPHGTSTYGINFGRGTGNPLGRGMMPEATGIFADYDFLTNRYTHTARLLQDPYNAVYQSNSWGSATTTAYTTISAEMDDILFINDFTLLNSQSNTGNQTSRPQAWAKNVVSIGGIRHFNTASFTDDRWGNGASIGPASDGRMKPELAHFYDSVFSPSNSSDAGYTNFSGTSAATPIVAGHFGIFFQMWHNGIFGNQTGATVFESRPHMTTTKAVMINTAAQWDMTIAGTDITRARQGFGRPDLTNLYNLRHKMLIVNETDVLTNLQTKSYSVTVPTGSTDPLKVTMVYNDPMGSPSATRSRINDLSLKVTAPDGTIYWGNNGLSSGMWSTSGGTANIIDTTENVFIQMPATGTWTIEVIASELVQDARTETAGVIDVDFALVASGIERTQASRTAFDYDGDGKADVSVFRASSGIWYLNNSQSGFSGAQFGAAGDRIVPADYDGDGKTDLAVYRAGTWYINRTQAGFTAVGFGAADDLTVPADFDGDGKAELAVFRPSNGTWYVYNLANNQVTTVSFGQAGDVPVFSDFDGDGRANFAVFRSGTWYIARATGVPAQNFEAVVFGAAGDRAVAADYDGDGKTDVAVYRPSNGIWYIQRSRDGLTGVQFGANGDFPAAADYDGDGKADVAVFRAGTWYINRSQAGFTGLSFGAATDLATPNAFVR